MSRARNRRPASPTDRASVAPTAGLCGQCRHLEVLRSRTSTFVRCGRADWDERLTRYPPLPRLACVGFEPDRETPPETD